MTTRRASPASSPANDQTARPAPTTRNGAMRCIRLPKTTPATLKPTTNADCSSPKYLAGGERRTADGAEGQRAVSRS